MRDFREYLRQGGLTMPNTGKQTAIRKAYGEYWEKVKDKVDSYGRLTIQQCWDLWNGDSAESHFYSVILQDKTLDLHDDYQGYYQPRSLQGIENNNGWIRIESEEDLPKEDKIECHLIINNGSMELHGGFRRYSKETFYFFNAKGEGFLIDSVTHYQPIVKPEKPIY